MEAAMNWNILEVYTVGKTEKAAGLASLVFLF